jgi:glycosyltransferase involved in cell wall biosynthesis
MRIGFLASTMDAANGWGRYATGFLAEARARGEAVAPDPSRIRSREVGWKQILLAPADALRLRRALSGVEVLHAASEPVAPLAYVLSLLLGVPYVVSVHGTYGDLATYPRAVRWLYRLAFSRAARLVAVSRYTADVVRRSLPEARVSIVPGGFSPPRPSARPTGGGPPKVLAVGAVKPRKGFHALVEALGLLAGRGVPFEADIVGPKEPTPYVARLETRLRELGLEARARLRGRVAQDELDRAYASADVFVLPSEHDGTAFEGLGLVYLEALARGVPAIGCRDSGAEDVIRDGGNGLLVPPGDPERLAAAVGRLLEDGALRARLAAAAPESVARFRWDRVGAEMQDAYMEAKHVYAR